MNGKQVARIDDAALEARFARAEEALTGLRGEFRGWARDTIARANDLAPELADDQVSQDTIETLYTIAHDFKGSAGGVGYDLMSAVANSLCQLLNERQPPLSPIVRKATEAHLRALGLIVEQDLLGDGGPTGKRLMDHLAALNQKAN